MWKTFSHGMKTSSKMTEQSSSSPVEASGWFSGGSPSRTVDSRETIVIPGAFGRTAA